MPTLDDLHSAFSELAQQAPVALTDPVRPTHRRRWAAMGLAAACMAAVAIAIPFVPSSRHDSPAPANSVPVVSEVPAAEAFPSALPAPHTGESPVLAYGFATDGAGGLTVVPDQVTATYQHASISADTSSSVGQVLVFYAGAYDPTRAEQGTPVGVGDRPGYYAQVDLPDSGTTDALVWQYADDGWAVVTVSGPTDAVAALGKNASKQQREQAQAEQAARRAYDQTVELRLAENTHAASTPMVSPVRVPASSGLHVSSLASGAPDGGLDLAAPDGTAWFLGWSPFSLNPGDKPGTSTVTAGGRQWIVYRSGGVPSALGLVAGRWGMTLTPAGGATLDQMEQFAATLQFAPDLADQGTWFAAGSSLP